MHKVISLRLSEDVYARCSAAAAEREVSLGAYLREKIENHQVMSDELEAIHERLESLAERASPGGAGEASTSDLRRLLAIALETLLMLRQQVGNPRVMQMVHKELERVGIEAWR
jgi:hypothetical protein